MESAHSCHRGIWQMTSDPSNIPDELGPLMDQYLERFRRGEDPSVSEYAQKYPQFSKQILEIFPTLAIMEDVAAVANDDRESATLSGNVKRQRYAAPESP